MIPWCAWGHLIFLDPFKISVDGIFNLFKLTIICCLYIFVCFVYLWFDFCVSLFYSNLSVQNLNVKLLCITLNLLLRLIQAGNLIYRWWSCLNNWFAKTIIFCLCSSLYSSIGCQYGYFFISLSSAQSVWLSLQISKRSRG